MIETETVCECGIKCQRIMVDGAVHFYCPRCQREVGQVVRPFEGESSGLVECTSIEPPFWSFLCENCGTPMPCACRARCPSCGWEKPCG